MIAIKYPAVGFLSLTNLKEYHNIDDLSKIPQLESWHPKLDPRHPKLEPQHHVLGKKYRGPNLWHHGIQKQSCEARN